MRDKRNVYLKMKTLEEAKEILFKSFQCSDILPTETVSVPDGFGRTLAEPVFARLSSPNFHAAAMDGIAVKAENTFGASESRPKTLFAGKDFFYVNTGNVIPESCDAVIMIEQVNVIDATRVEIESPSFPWQYVRRMGEDIVATELLFPRSHVITSYCIGAFLSGGVFSIPVRKKPKVLIIPTGSELVDWRDDSLEKLEPGQVLETNSYVLEGLVESCGGICVRHEMLADNHEKIKQAVDYALGRDFDMVLTVGGSSAGSEDFTKRVVMDLGEVLVHGVTIMPGKPLIIGRVKEKPIFGIPGYPVSAIIAFEQFVRPLICEMLGKPDVDQPKVQVYPTRKIASKLGMEEFLRVKLGTIGEKIVATPLPRGSGSITTITDADGIIRIPNHVEGIRDNTPVSAELLRPRSLIKNTVVIVGSHDNTLDVLADQIRSGHTGLSISSSHVGSMGGLMAVKKGTCHLAGSHLLDLEDGTYNVSYIKKYLPGLGIKLVNLVFRDQGLMAMPENPKGIKGVEDLARDDILFMNRQNGSGTRILLDYRLKATGVNPEMITGYENEEFTHMAVAVAVLSGTVDTGLGIYAAAKALGLDFIPIVTEQYDLVIPEEHFESDNIQILLETINGEAFQKRVRDLGGYSTEKTGEVVDI